MLADEDFRFDSDPEVEDRDTDSSYVPSAACASSSEEEENLDFNESLFKSKRRNGERRLVRYYDQQVACTDSQLSHSYGCNQDAQIARQSDYSVQEYEQGNRDYEVEVAEFPKIISIRGNCTELFENERRPAIEIPPILSTQTDKILNLYSTWGPDDGNFVCNVCDKLFKSERTVKRHMRTHLSFKEFECPVCGKMFRRKCQVTVHKRTHSTAKPHKCETCGRGFREMCALKTHRRVHTGEKRYLCEICDRPFSTQKLMERHLMLHIKAKPFVCRYCDKKFSRKCSLKDHMRCHLPTPKKHICCFCGKDFAQNSHLTKHMVVHTGKSNYYCDICDTQFHWHGSLYRHMRRTHSMTRNKDQVSDTWPKMPSGRIAVEEQNDEVPSVEDDEVNATGMTSSESGLDQSV